MVMNLYLLKNGIGEYYVVAPDPTAAKTLLELELHKAAYGYYEERKVKTITLLAEEVTPDHTEDKKLAFYMDNAKLLLAKRKEE